MHTPTEIPWPGPKPYEEKDWERFFGRDEYVDMLANKLATQRLTVLLGASGSGKTSLIRAGLVPLLRNYRYHSASNRSEGPVMVFRNWAATPKDNARDLVEQQLRDALVAIDKWHHAYPSQSGAENDGRELQAILDEHKGKDVVLAIEAIARSVADLAATRRGVPPPALVLVFDQLEELLRARDRQSERATGRIGREVLDLIGELYSRDAPLQMLISMREEYLYALRPLDRWVARLSERTMQLTPLKPTDARAIVAQVSARPNVIRLDNEILDNVMPSADAAESSADMLRLQAVLYALSRKAQQMGEVEVNRKVYDTYLRSAGEDHLFQQAIEDWIQSAIDGTAAASSADKTAAITAAAIGEWTHGSKFDIDMQVRRTALRIAPHLSSSDYKVPQEVGNLFRRALGSVVGVLFPENTSAIEKASVVASTTDGGLPFHVGWNSPDLEAPETMTAAKNRSGPARAFDWSRCDTADVIASCYLLTLQRFEERNILRRTQNSGSGVVCELVHDQMGPMLLSWAEGRRGDWIDSTSSLVALIGGTPITSDKDRIEGGTYTHVTWRGCTVQPRQSRFVFDSVVFDHCELRGIVFDRCTFRGVEFNACVLNGTVFRDCAFESHPTRKNTIRNSRESDLDCVLFLAGEIGSLQFENSVVRQPSFVGVHLRGDVVFANCAVAQLYACKLTSDDTITADGRVAVGAKIHIGRSSKAWCCSADDASFQRLDARKATHGAATVAEPDDLTELRAAQS